LLLAISIVALLTLDRNRDARAAGNDRLLCFMTVAIGAWMVAMPGAVRAHHMLNLMPLPHLIVAVAGIGTWRRNWHFDRLQGLARVCLSVTLATMLYSSVTAVAETRDLLRETGGRGRWSHSLLDFAREIDSKPDAEEFLVVSLDWGFHEPLLFVSDHIQLSEPIWSLSRGGNQTAEGNANAIYLIHPQRYDLFQLGPRFETALRFLEDTDYERRDYFDGTGLPTFSSIRFTGPHRIHYDGIFRIRLLE
jgi:hypothetical protein